MPAKKDDLPSTLERSPKEAPQKQLLQFGHPADDEPYLPHAHSRDHTPTPHPSVSNAPAVRNRRVEEQHRGREHAPNIDLPPQDHSSKR